MLTTLINEFHTRKAIHLEHITTSKATSPRRGMIQQNFTDKSDEWRSLARGSCRRHNDPRMKDVLAEIVQETDVIDDLWRHARETKFGKVMEERTNVWGLPPRNH